VPWARRGGVCECSDINKVTILINLLHVYFVSFIGYFFIICLFMAMFDRFTSVVLMYR
jgi:hypothetical protein